VRKAVREQLRAGADFIKVMTTGLPKAGGSEPEDHLDVGGLSVVE
jgi:hypothetical protein